MFEKHLFSERLAAGKNSGKLDLVVPGATGVAIAEAFTGATPRLRRLGSFLKRGDRISAGGRGVLVGACVG